MKFIAITVACCAMGLTGCAVNMQTAGNDKPVTVGTAAAKKVVLGVDGSAVAKSSDSWSSLAEALQEGCKEEASSAGLPIEFQQGAARATGEAGTLLALYVNDFRYVSTGMRLGLGVMTGNAFIDANAKFLDLNSGAVWGERPYATKSSAWEGIGSAMTAKQAQAICKNMIDVVRGSGGLTKNP
jgi:hypothetical protein